MPNISEITKEILASIPEIAAETDEYDLSNFSSASDQLADYYRAQIIRANLFLDRHKDRVFNDVLNLSTRGQVERAIESYDTIYLLSLGLSLDSTSELAQRLIRIAKQYPVNIPESWLKLSGMDFNLEYTESVYNRKIARV